MTRLPLSALAAALLVAAVSNRSHAADVAPAVGERSPAVGDQAPAFKAETDDGKPWNSGDHVGKKVVVVYFYPADMTGGCTAQACGFRDAIQQAKFDPGKVEIIGVSGDTVANHEKFKKEHDLNFTLLADPDGKIAKAFGVKTAPGGTINATLKHGSTTELSRGITSMRTTFVLGKDGKIADKAEISDAGGDPNRVIGVVEKLSVK